MNKFIAFLLFVLAYNVTHGQCSTVSVLVSSSDTFYVQLYHPGFFNIPSGFDNICEWEVTSFSGEILHQETTSGNANDQGVVIFDHSIPITDSMKVNLVITNNTEGITCTINDTLYWKKIEILPDVFIGNWEVLSSNGGVEKDITTSLGIIPNDQNIILYPTLVNDHFTIKSNMDNHTFNVFDSNGQFIISYKNIRPQEKVDISHYSEGVYFIQLWNEESKKIISKKLVKM